MMQLHDLDYFIAGFIASYGCGEAQRSDAETALAAAFGSLTGSDAGLAERISDRWNASYGGRTEPEQRRRALACIAERGPSEAVRKLAGEFEVLAKIPALPLSDAHPMAADDRSLQRGIENARPVPIERSIVDRRFLIPGRFPGHPDVRDPRPAAEMEQEGPPGDPSPGLDLGGEAAALELAQAMDQQWSMLHERGLPGQVNINSLTRARYNLRGIERIEEHLDRSPVDVRRVLCCTGYETPLSPLLNRSNIDDVVVADLAAGAHRTVAKKYPASVAAGVLRPTLLDFSCLSADWQLREIRALSTSGSGGTRLTRHLTDLASGSAFQPLPFPDSTFAAVHAPFVCGALHLGAMIAVACARSSGHVDLSEAFGVDVPQMPGMAEAMLTTTGHALDEFKRVLAPGGLLVVNLWARPIEIEGELFIKLSDTHLTPDQAQSVVRGMQHDFTGNPQPTLPFTVGRILTYSKPYQDPV